VYVWLLATSNSNTQKHIIRRTPSGSEPQLDVESWKCQIKIGRYNDCSSHQTFPMGLILNLRIKLWLIATKLVYI